MLSVRIAPHALWDQTGRNSLFGSDLSKKMSIIQIMIDNYVDIFGDEDHIICDHNQKSSDDKKMSINTADMGDDNYWWRPVQGVPRLFYTEPLVKADMGGLQRTLLCQGPVELTRGTKTNRRHLSLFDDILVVSSNLSIDAAKMDMKKPFSLKIFTEDIPTCDTHLYVTATKFEKVNDIMKKLLPMIRMPNSEDFELWFCPGHEEAPRALHGYECPHKVLMNHLQINLGRWKSKISTAFPIFPGLFVKDFNMDEEGQFILKPRNSARIQQQNEKERPRKTKRPLMTSCFHRASVPHRDQMCTDPKVKKTGQLFGKQLSCICPNGKWPQAILDILYRLREKGPTTQSIFAKAPNETSCKTLKDKLDNGEVVAIKNYSIHDVAWILKEFLRLIKGSLMTAQLYDKWLAVPQKANHKEKLTAVRSLLDNLPAPNAALLGQLFRILHEISKNASFNLMSAQNLSAEIAPYILWMPTYRNKVLANYITEKISLVTFLISNSPELFGLDVVAVWYETSFFSPTSTNTSCAHNSPSIINKGKETEHGINTCPSGRTYSPGHDAPAITPVAPPLHEGNIEKGEGSVDTTQQAISKTDPAPIKKHGFRSFPPISCLDRMLPSPILDMLSIIERRGQNTDQIFRYLPGKSHWSLRDKIYTEQDINWHEQSVITISSVLKDFLRNIQGSLLSSDLYEDWLSVVDEKSLIGKILAIKSILLNMPQANYDLLKQLICVLLQIKMSTRKNLDTYMLSVRIAPHVLWDQTGRNSLFGSDLSRKMSIIQIMIDNYVDIFGDEDHIICDHNQKSSDDKKMSINTAGYECPHKVLMNHLQINLGRWKSKISTAFPILPGLFVKDFNMDEEGQFILKPRNSARIQQQNEKERPRKTKRPLMTSCFHRASVPHRDQMCTDPKVKKTGQLFGEQLSCICPNGKWPQAILDILYRLREKGPTTQSIFAKAPNETSCKTLKDKLDNGEVVAIKNYSLHDVAWILKEFLRLIKGSLMTAQLYDKWLAVPQKANHKEKLTAVRSLLDNLPAPNAALLGQLFRILHEISKNASLNLMSAQNLSAEIAPYILWMPTYRNKVLANYITEKISLVTFLISNSPELFGLDVVAVWYETSFFSPTSTNTSCAHNSPSIINKGKETEHGINTCPSGRTYSPGHDAPAITPVAPPLHEGNIEKGEGSVDTTQQAISKTAPAPIKKHGFRSFPPISCLDRMLPSPILDMLSIIERRGQNTDQIFRYLPGKSHWSLRDKIYTEQDINWHEQSVITISSVLKDFLRNIQGSLLSSDLYEDWLSVVDEKSLIGKILAIKSILLKLPQANYDLLKQLICVLLQIKMSTRNNLDTYMLSVRIAPHVLWDQTGRNSLFGSDLSRKMSIIQIMIDNYVDIFGDEDHIICDHNQKSSDDKKMSINTADHVNYFSTQQWFLEKVVMVAIIGGDLYKEYLDFSKRNPL
ncbi:uncharacterized protein LOC127673799 [Apodemus sylvaticus]|uniref:uncharacterized protein LOC127673799 n=1 Tax=Apodemus sylvaticus TaxID=10129 RepID=UPI002242FA91|nr:uncharacterized protein LOC127673799 [Apodemus sylvaticus]